MVISGVAVHERDGQVWASPPSKPLLDRDGKLRWSPIVGFVDRQTQTVWSDAVVAALRASHPEALT